jgi:glycosyltransferase involved in cell wall biosynthesis
MENNKNVLVLADFLFPEYLGGSARLASALNDDLIRSGYSVTCVTRRSHGHYSSKYAVERNYRIIYIDNFLEVLNVVFFQDWNVVISHHYTFGVINYLFLKKSTPLLYFFHGPVHLEWKAKGGNQLGALLRRIIEYIVLFKCDRIFCLSDYMKSYIPSNFHSKSIVIGPIHNYTSSNYNSSNKFDNFEKINLLVVRRLTPRTGVIELAEMVSRLNGKVNLKIVGSGELLLTLKNMNLNNVDVLGSVDENELNILYKSSNLVVLPSRDLEGFGLIILESIFRGTPVLASSKSGGGAEFLAKFSQDFIYDINCTEDEFLVAANNAINAFSDTRIRNLIISKLMEYKISNFIKNHISVN